MTTEWRETVPCPRCGLEVSTESPVKAWIRSHEDLDSRRKCLCVGDSDLWIQRYGTRRHQSGVDRNVMYLMLVEIKSHGRGLETWQRDLLHVVNQLLRTNRWKERRDGGQFQPGHPQNARVIYSIIAGQKVQLQCYGVHILRLSGATPDVSDWIKWDDKPISREQLLLLLRYDLHPDSLRPMEHRSHKRTVSMPALFGIAEMVQRTT